MSSLRRRRSWWGPRGSHPGRIRSPGRGGSPQEEWAGACRRWRETKKRRGRVSKGCRIPTGKRQVGGDEVYKTRDSVGDGLDGKRARQTAADDRQTPAIRSDQAVNSINHAFRLPRVLRGLAPTAAHSEDEDLESIIPACYLCEPRRLPHPSTTLKRSCGNSQGRL